MVEEVTTKSWGSRLKDALVGIVIGLLLIAIAVYIIFWNEKHQVHTEQSLIEAQNQLITVPASPVDPKNNLQVIYLKGLATTKEVLTDPVLNFKLNAIALIRNVEMYQWQENVQTKTESQVGGSEKTIKTYSYKQVWSERLLDSTQYKEASSHQNPSSMPAQSQRFVATNVTLGDFSLPADLVQKITGTESVDISKIDLPSIQNAFNLPVKIINNQIFIGKNSGTPQVGDLRISESAVLPQMVSIIAQQTGSSLQTYMAKAGEPVLLLSLGEMSSDAMIANALAENRMITWVLRLATFLMMVIGLSLMMKPFVVIADILPIAGKIAGFGTGLVAVITGFCLWAIFTSIAWMTTRPLYAVILLGSVGLIVYLFVRFRAKKNIQPLPPS